MPESQLDFHLNGRQSVISWNRRQQAKHSVVVTYLLKWLNKTIEVRSSEAFCLRTKWLKVSKIHWHFFYLFYRRNFLGAFNVICSKLKWLLVYSRFLHNHNPVQNINTFYEQSPVQIKNFVIKVIWKQIRGKRNEPPPHIQISRIYWTIFYFNTKC